MAERQVTTMYAPSCEVCEHSDRADYGIGCTLEPEYYFAMAYLSFRVARWYPDGPDGCRRMREQARTCAAWEPMGIKEERG